MTDENLDDEIKTLAVQIEKRIKAQKIALEEAPDFDPKHRRMAEANVDVASLFS